MKKLFTLLLALVVASPLWAQKERFHPKRGAILDGKTIIKANIASPFLGAYNFSAERMLVRGLSLQVGVSTRPDKALPMSERIDEAIASSDFKLKDISIGSFALTPELRWYVGGGYGHGFYMMAYYRYQTYKVSGYQHKFDIESTQYPQGRTVELALQGDMKTNSLGFGFGAQWLIGKKKNIVLDWNIVGAHYGEGKLNLSGDVIGTGLSQEEVTEVRRELTDAINDVPVVKINQEDVEITTNHAALKNVSTPWAFLRGSISIGFRF